MHPLRVSSARFEARLVRFRQFVTTLQISDEGANALAKLVEGTPTLLSVSLDNNSAISEGAKAGVRTACETNEARSKMMQEAAKIYLNTNDPAFLLRTMRALSL